MDFKEFIKLDELTRWKKELAAKKRDASRAPFPSRMVKSQAQDYGNIKNWDYGIPGRREGEIEKKIRSMKATVDPLAQKAPGSVAKMAADRRAASQDPKRGQVKVTGPGRIERQVKPLVKSQ